jgi:hypothetical protein
LVPQSEYSDDPQASRTMADLLASQQAALSHTQGPSKEQE